MVVALLTATLRPSKAPVPPERGVKWTDAAAPPTNPDPWITRVVSCPAFACAGWTPESDGDAAGAPSTVVEVATIVTAPGRLDGRESFFGLASTETGSCVCRLLVEPNGRGTADTTALRTSAMPWAGSMPITVTACMPPVLSTTRAARAD